MTIRIFLIAASFSFVVAHPMSMFSRSSRFIERQASIFDISGVVQQVDVNVHNFIQDIKNIRRLEASTCDFWAAFSSSAGSSCGSTVANPTVSSAAEFARFCTAGCGAKLKATADALLAAFDCATENDRMTVRIMGELCTQGTFQGSTKFCYASDIYTSFVNDLTSLSQWDAGKDVSSYCVADGCTGKLLKAVVSGSNAMDRAIWDMIGKYLCTSQPGASQSCWTDFATMMTCTSDLSETYVSSRCRPLMQMLNSPSTFCRNSCRKAGLIDFFKIKEVMVTGSLQKMQARASLQMAKGMMSFSCLQKEDNQYCISVILNRVAVANAVNYDGTSVTKPICSEPEESEEDDEEGRATCDDFCLPFCKTDAYVCNDKIGKCDDFTKCNASRGSFPQHQCTCTEKIGQLISYAGCCLDGFFEFQCDMMKSALTPDNTIDMTMCDIETSTETKYPLTKALSRGMSCGFTPDPRCTHGKDVSTTAFNLTFANVDTAAACAAPGAAAASIRDEMSSILSAPSEDIEVELCPTDARLSPTENTLHPKVTVEASGATNLDLVKSFKNYADDSGKTKRELDKTKGLTGALGKVVTVLHVGAETTTTKSGINGSTPEQAKVKMLAVKKPVTTGDSVSSTTLAVELTAAGDRSSTTLEVKSVSSTILATGCPAVCIAAFLSVYESVF